MATAVSGTERCPGGRVITLFFHRLALREVTFILSVPGIGVSPRHPATPPEPSEFEKEQDQLSQPYHPSPSLFGSLAAHWELTSCPASPLPEA